MNTNDSSPLNETAKMFISESDKIKISIENYITNVERLSVKEIIEIYYKVINVNSLLKFLNQNFEDFQSNKTLSDTMQETAKIVQEKFNGKLHPLLRSQMENLFENSKERLNTKSNQSEKTKHEIESQAKEYENLRQIMSTKEFVEQYDKTLEKRSRS